MIKVMLVEDQTIVREGLRRLLDATGAVQVIGEAETVAEAVRTARTITPDVIVMDLKLGNESGLDATRAILAERPETSVLALTAFDDFEMVQEAISVGVLGYAPKMISTKELVQALQAVASGEQYIHPTLLPVLLGGIRRTARDRNGGRPEPTDEERALLRLLAGGESLAGVAAKLFVSERTVRRRVQLLCDRIEVINSVQAVALATKEGWL